jgi:hypothetical protein
MRNARGLRRMIARMRAGVIAFAVCVSHAMATPLDHVRRVEWTHASAEFTPTRTSSGTPLRWAGSCVFIRPHVAGATDVTDFAAAVEQATTAWRTATSACGYLRFELEPPEAGEVGLDFVNRIVVREQEWCAPGPPKRCHDPSAIGLTTLFFVDKPGDPMDGVILDADIELNAVDFALATCNGSPGGCVTTGSGPPSDIANVLAHELGHVLGLDHTCNAGPPDQAPLDGDGQPVPPCNPVADLPPEVTAATMYNFSAPEEIDKRTPETDDIDGFCRSYPIASDPASCAPVTPPAGFDGAPDGPPAAGGDGGGCCQGAPADATPWLVALLFVLSARRRRG